MVYENIKDICDKRKISICQLEKNAGLKNGTIGKWRDHSPNLKNLEKVASTLNVTVNRLIRNNKSDT